MRELEIGPFAEPPRFTLTELLAENIYSVTLALVILLLLISAGFLNALNLSRRFRQSENYRKQVFEGSHIPMVVMSLYSDDFLDMNPAAVRLYGFQNKEQLIGKNLGMVSSPHQEINTSIPQAIEEIRNEVITDGSATFEWRHVRPDGEEWVAKIHLMILHLFLKLYLF